MIKYYIIENFNKFKKIIYLPINLLGKIIQILIREMNIKNEKKFFDIYEKYIELELKNSLIHFHQYFKKSLFLDFENIREYSINQAIKKYNINELFLEFGVRRGNSINLFSKILLKSNIPIYGFDSFFGLNEDWLGNDRKKGDMSTDGKLPEFKHKNITYVKGLVQNTLNNFLKKKNEKIRFTHMDLDTYSSTKFVLNAIKPWLARDSFILFDQFYNYPGWENGEYKSFLEVLSFFQKAYCAAFAGFIGALCGNPPDLALVRMQADGQLPPEERRNYKNVFNAFSRILSGEM